MRQEALQETEMWLLGPRTQVCLGREGAREGGRGTHTQGMTLCRMKKLRGGGEAVPWGTRNGIEIAREEGRARQGVTERSGWETERGFQQALPTPLHPFPTFHPGQGVLRRGEQTSMRGLPFGSRAPSTCHLPLLQPNGNPDVWPRSFPPPASLPHPPLLGNLSSG